MASEQEARAREVERRAVDLIAFIDSLQPAPVDEGNGMALCTVIPQFHKARDRILEAVFWARDGIAEAAHVSGDAYRAEADGDEHNWVDATAVGDAHAWRVCTRCGAAERA